MGGERRLVAAVVAIGVLTTLSVVVADLATPGLPEESTAPPEERSGSAAASTMPANRTVATNVTPPTR